MAFDATEDPLEVPGILQNWMPSSVRVLDVGCATGSMTLRINRGKNNQVIGLEPDEERATLARSRGLNVVSGILDESFVKSQELFDVVVLADVIEHVPAPAQLLETAVTALTEDGIILASVPNIAHWTVRLRLLLGRFEYTEVGIMDATHLRWFTQKSFRDLFERQGLKVVSISASAGTYLGAYRRLPFTLMPSGLRERLICGLVAKFPRLFGCGLLIKAVRAR